MYKVKCGGLDSYAPNLSIFFLTWVRNLIFRTNIQLETSDQTTRPRRPLQFSREWVIHYYTEKTREKKNYTLKSTASNVLSKIEWIFTLFVTDVTMITSFGVNIEWTGRDSTRWVVTFTPLELESSEIHSSTNEISSLHRWSDLFTRYEQFMWFVYNKNTFCDYSACFSFWNRTLF